MRNATAQIGNTDSSISPPASHTPAPDGNAEAQTAVEDGDSVPNIRRDSAPTIPGDSAPDMRGDFAAGRTAADEGSTQGGSTDDKADSSDEQESGPRRGALVGALQVGGATLSATSGNRFARGAGTAARVAGWMMERKMDREARAGLGGKPAGRSASRTGSTNAWRGMAAGLGASSPAGYAAATGPLSRLEEQYGSDAVRSAAQESLGPAIAARRFGNETAPSMATQDGFYTRGPAGQPQPDVSAWIGSTVENRLRTMPGGAHSGPRIYPDSPPSAPAAPGGAGPTPSLLDFRQGAQMAEALGYGSHDQQATRALASLHHVHRSPRLGFDAGSARDTVEAAWTARSALAGVAGEQMAAARAAFLHDVSQIAQDHGHTDEFIYPTPWSNLAARIRADAGIDQ